MYSTVREQFRALETVLQQGASHQETGVSLEHALAYSVVRIQRRCIEVVNRATREKREGSCWIGSDGDVHLGTLVFFYAYCCCRNLSELAEKRHVCFRVLYHPGLLLY